VEVFWAKVVVFIVELCFDCIFFLGERRRF